MESRKNLNKNILAITLMGIIFMSSIAFLSSVSSSSGSSFDDSGMDSSNDLNEIDDSGMDSPSDLNEGFDDDSDEFNNNDVGEVKIRLSDGTLVEVEIGIPLSSVTVEGKNIAVQKARDFSEGTIDRIEVEIEDGRLVWNVRLFTSDGKRVDVRIDDETKNLVRSRVESESGKINSEEIQNLDLSGRSGSNSNNNDDSSLEISEDDNSGNQDEDREFFVVRMWKSIVDFFRS